MFHALLFSSKSFGPVPPPPPPIHNVSVQGCCCGWFPVLFSIKPLLIGGWSHQPTWLEEMIPSFPLRSWSTTDRLTPSSSEEEKLFSTSTYGGQRFLWRRDAALLFSGTDGATNIRKISLLYLATVGNMINFYSNKRKVGVSYRLYFSTLLVQCYLWASVCLWRLYTVFLGFIWCCLLFCMYLGLYSLVIFAYFINIDVCALSP